MSSDRRTAVLGASFVLQHVPDLVRYGSKPQREPQHAQAIARGLRTYDDALAYPPNQVFIGNVDPSALWELPRPWWTHPAEGAAADGATGELLGQRAFYDLLAEVDRFELVRLKEEPRPGGIPLLDGGELYGAVASADPDDEALSARVLLENISIKASAVHAVNDLLRRTPIDLDSITLAIGCGEEAIGDRYQRGGGNLAKAVAEHCGLQQAAGFDVKSFCAAPVHAMVAGASLIEAGVEENVLVLAGGSLAKLGMKFEGALAKGVPILEDVLAGMALLLAPADGSNGPVVRTDAVGRLPVAAAASPQTQLQALVGRPLDALGLSVHEVDVYATEIHNPEITEPQGGGDVPDRNYKMLAGLGVVRGELERSDIPAFARTRGLPGFSPTQGHIASAVPWLPHALRRFQRGDLARTMLMAKGSLFLGRLTRSWDGVSIVLEG